MEKCDSEGAEKENGKYLVIAQSNATAANYSTWTREKSSYG